MSTDNMDDGEDHSRIIAVHEWLHSALYAESAYPSSKWWVHSLCLGKLLDIPGGTAGVDNFAKRLKKNIARPGCCGGAKKINVDDHHGNNVLGLRRRWHGRKIKKSERTVFHESTSPRWTLLKLIRRSSTSPSAMRLMRSMSNSK